MISGQMWPLLIAALSGVLMAVQGSLNTVLSKAIGLLETTFFVHLTGTLVLAAALFLFQLGRGDLMLFLNAPWYSYLGGVVGVGIIYLVVASIPVIGVSNATTAIIVGQVLTAVIIDRCGIFGLQKYPVGWEQILGLALLAIGAKLLIR